MAERGERLLPYSFRHSYSLRCHQGGIDGGSAAAAMGHSYEVHCRSYPWASEAGVLAAFNRARAQFSYAQPAVGTVEADAALGGSSVMLRPFCLTRALGWLCMGA